MLHRTYSHILLSCVALLALILPNAAHAEKLTEATIRNMYQKMADDVSDAAKTSVNINYRLSPDYKMKVHMTKIIGNNPPMESDEVWDKKKIIEDTATSFKMSTMYKFEYNIIDIRYSQDGQTAYVSNTSRRSGMVIIKLPDGRVTSKPYESGMGCVDTLDIENASIAMSMSECRARNIIGQ